MKKGDIVKIKDYTGMSNNRFVILEINNDISKAIVYIGREKSGGLLGDIDKTYISKERLEIVTP